MRRKKELSPIMTTLPPQLAEALSLKRAAIAREIDDFCARKEEELRAFERKLFAGFVDGDFASLAADQLRLNGVQKLPSSNAAEPGEAASPRSHPAKLPRPASAPATWTTRFGTATTTLELPPTPLSANASPPTTPQSLPTPRHDKERELHGLFLPGFIPLLGSPPQRRDSNPAAARPHNTEIPATRAGVTPPDPTAFSPRTSPSPSLIASAPPPQVPDDIEQDDLVELDDSFPPLTRSGSSSRRTSPEPDQDVPASSPIDSPNRTSQQPSKPHVQIKIPSSNSPSSHSYSSSLPTSSITQSASCSGPGNASQLRPTPLTRTPSTQSEGSANSNLRSSLRKTSSYGPGSDSDPARKQGHGRKKSVRISIDNVVLAPTESPVQTRASAWLPPPVTPLSGSYEDDELLTMSNGKAGESSDGNRDVESHKRDCGEKAGVEHKKSGSSRASPTAGGEHKRRSSTNSQKKRSAAPHSLDISVATPKLSSDSSLKQTPKQKPTPVMQVPDYFPPQPLRSPTGKSHAPPRPLGTELIQPTTPPFGTSHALGLGTVRQGSHQGSHSYHQNTSPLEEENDADADDPLFGGGSGGIGKKSPRHPRTSSAGSNRSDGAGTGGPPSIVPGLGDDNEEDLFRDEEDGREDMDVVNGHDLLEEERRSEHEGPRSVMSSGSGLPSPSPHAYSLPIAILARSGNQR